MHGGGPVILARLLRGLTEDSYSIVTNRKQLFAGAVKTGGWLPASYYFLDENDPKSGHELENITIDSRPTGHSAQRSPLVNWLARIAADAITLPEILRVRDKIHHILSVNQALTTVYATSDDGTFLLGTYLATKKTKKRLVVHLFDLYAGNAFGPFRQLLAKLYEPKILHRADQIIVTSQHTADYLNSKYHNAFAKKIIPVYHPLPDRNPPTTTRRSPSEPFEIIYTGTLGWPQKDCLVDLVHATRNLAAVKITILAPYSSSQLAAWGLVGPHVETGSVSPSEAEKRQQQADALFLPMAFHPESHDIVATASPGKIAEYLQVGKPILVYAPAFSHIARYARETGFGLVVDHEGDKPLQTGIKRLQDDLSLQTELIHQARATFLKNHEEKLVLKQFRAAVEGDQ